MASEEHAWPGFSRACLLISLDNGGINRDRSERQQNREFRKWMAKQDCPNLAEMEAWLSALSETDVELFCIGGTGEPDADAIRAKAPPFLDDLLNSYFDEVC